MYAIANLIEETWCIPWPYAASASVVLISAIGILWSALGSKSKRHREEIRLVRVEAATAIDRYQSMLDSIRVEQLAEIRKAREADQSLIRNLEEMLKRRRGNDDD